MPSGRAFGIGNSLGYFVKSKNDIGETFQDSLFNALSFTLL